MPDPTIPIVYIVFNGPLGMSPGKMTAQAFQLAERLFRAADSYDVPMGERVDHLQRVGAWRKHTTTITRVAKTPTMWERVKAEVEGVVMVDEGYTEVEPGSETCFASWPMLVGDAPKILSNAKVPLL
jgi:peptidyl-tRNA hydrolase